MREGYYPISESMDVDDSEKTFRKDKKENNELGNCHVSM